MKSDYKIGNFLSDSQIARYWDEGYLFPVSVFSKEEAASYRADLEKIEQDWGVSEKLGRPLINYKRVHSEIVMPLASKMALSPQVLDAVEGILGPNIMIWGAEFFIKEAHSKHIVTMHQDLT